MNNKVFFAIFAVFFTANAQADTVGLYLGAQAWQGEASGVLGEENTLLDFNLKREQQTSYFIAVEHPFPLLPNIRISTTRLDTTGNTDLTQAFSFGNETFPMGSTKTGTDDHTGANMITTTDVNARANVNIRYVDYTLYYELFDNDTFSFDLGLTARTFNGDVIVTGTTTTVITVDEAAHFDHVHPATEETTISTAKGKIKTDEIEPMLYVATNISLPLAGLSAFGQGDFSLIGDHIFSDYQVGLGYDLIDNRMMDINLTLGYRAVNIELENSNNLYTNLEFNGAFVGVIAHF